MTPCLNSARAVLVRTTTACAFLVAMLLAGSVSAQEQAPRAGGEVTLALGSDPNNINPDLSSNFSNQLIGCMIYQGLVQVTQDSEIKPLLAKSWQISPDGLTYTFDLVKASWQDGKPFTSDDVKYTLTEISSKYGPIFSAAGKTIDSVEAPAPDKVIIKLKHPFGPLLMSLACPQNGAILPAHLFRGTDPLTNPASLDKPVGTGPFQMVEWIRGQDMRLRRNPNYWEAGKPYLDQIIARPITQAASRLQALRAGNIDFIAGYDVPPTDFPVVRATPGLKLVNSGFAPETESLFINVTHKPLDDKRVRQALMLATNRDFLFKAVWGGTGGVGIMPFTSKLRWAINPDVDYRKMYPYNVDRANQLLDQAGVARHPDGTRFTVTFVQRAEDADVGQVAEALRSMWRPIGVDVKVEVVEGSSFADRVYTKGDFDLTMVGYTSYGDPALGIARTFVTTSIGRPFGNASRYSNSEVDTLFEKGASQTTLQDRAVYYKQAQAILAKDLPTLTFHEFAEDDAASVRLHGLWGGQGYGIWGNAWMSK